MELAPGFPHSLIEPALGGGGQGGEQRPGEGRGGIRPQRGVGADHGGQTPGIQKRSGHTAEDFMALCRVTAPKKGHFDSSLAKAVSHLGRGDRLSWVVGKIGMLCLVQPQAPRGAVGDNGQGAYKIILDGSGPEQTGQWHKASDVFVREKDDEDTQISWENLTQR